MDPETAIGADAQCNGSLPATRAVCRAVIIDRLAEEIDDIKAQFTAADYDDSQWQSAMDTAHRLLAERGGA